MTKGLSDEDREFFLNSTVRPFPRVTSCETRTFRAAPGRKHQQKGKGLCSGLQPYIGRRGRFSAEASDGGFTDVSVKLLVRFGTQIAQQTYEGDIH